MLSDGFNEMALLHPLRPNSFDGPIMEPMSLWRSLAGSIRYNSNRQVMATARPFNRNFKHVAVRADAACRR
jgi:hypothetical protein